MKTLSLLFLGVLLGGCVMPTLKDKPVAATAWGQTEVPPGTYRLIGFVETIAGGTVKGRRHWVKINPDATGELLFTGQGARDGSMGRVRLSRWKSPDGVGVLILDRLHVPDGEQEIIGGEYGQGFMFFRVAQSAGAFVFYRPNHSHLAKALGLDPVKAASHQITTAELSRLNLELLFDYENPVLLIPEDTTPLTANRPDVPPPVQPPAVASPLPR